jgi:hypothetical protein
MDREVKAENAVWKNGIKSRVTMTMRHEPAPSDQHSDRQVRDIASVDGSARLRARESWKHRRQTAESELLPRVVKQRPKQTTPPGGCFEQANAMHEAFQRLHDGSRC